MQKLLLIAFAGAIGTIARYAISGWTQRIGHPHFPTGTLIVNVVGCFCIGIAASTLIEPRLAPSATRAAVMVGLLGGLTTFSTFGYETVLMLRGKQYAMATANVLLNNLLGFAAVMAALWLMSGVKAK